MRDEDELDGACSKGEEDARKMTDQGLNLESLRGERLMSGGMASSVDE